MSRRTVPGGSAGGPSIPCTDRSWFAGGAGSSVVGLELQHDVRDFLASRRARLISLVRFSSALSRRTRFSSSAPFRGPPRVDIVIATSPRVIAIAPASTGIPGPAGTMPSLMVPLVGI